MSPGRLILVGTPIGSLADLSPRARQTLAETPLWIVEDTRVSARLAREAGASPSMLVCNEQTRPERIRAYAERILNGEDAALITDGGMPVVSDPGAELVDLCAEMGIEVDCVPGPSAPITALALSGFYGQRWAFLGFLPRKPGPAAEVLRPFAESPLTLVLFESPHRFRKTLALAAEVLGERRAAICRELTKTHQQVWRGPLALPPAEAEVPSRGEVTLVIEGARRRAARYPCGDRSVGDEEEE